jgi:hypothetical protein
LRRVDLAGRFLYTAADSRRAKDQIRARRTAHAVPLVADATALAVSPDELKAAILLFFSVLDEQQRRLFAGLESIKLGRGGDTILATFLNPDPITSRAVGNSCSITRSHASGPGAWARPHARGKKTADIVTLIECLLEYDTGGDPLSNTRLPPSRDQLAFRPWLINLRGAPPSGATAQILVCTWREAALRIRV